MLPVIASDMVNQMPILSLMECIASDYAVSLQRLSTALHHVSLRPQRLASSYVAKNIFLIRRSWGILAMCPAYLTAC